jgi:hypothetical protein
MLFAKRLKMNIVIQISQKDDAKAWLLLQKKFSGIALPKRTFVLPEEAVRALREAGIRFREISRDGVLQPKGVIAGERI